MQWTRRPAAPCACAKADQRTTEMRHVSLQFHHNHALARTHRVIALILRLESTSAGSGQWPLGTALQNTCLPGANVVAATCCRRGAAWQHVRGVSMANTGPRMQHATCTVDGNLLADALCIGRGPVTSRETMLERRAMAFTSPLRPAAVLTFQ
jgi:hypothetical protein